MAKASRFPLVTDHGLVLGLVIVGTFVALCLGKMPATYAAYLVGGCVIVAAGMGPLVLRAAAGYATGGVRGAADEITGQFKILQGGAVEPPQPAPLDPPAAVPVTPRPRISTPPPRDPPRGQEGFSTLAVLLVLVLGCLAILGALLGGCSGTQTRVDPGSPEARAIVAGAHVAAGFVYLHTTAEGYLIVDPAVFDAGRE